MLFKLSIILLLSRGLLGETVDTEKRIINGKDAPDGMAPYQVSMRTQGKVEYHSCGGSIIDEQWVLTAAHCIYGKDMSIMSIVVGSHKINTGGDRYKIKKLIPHENFSMYNFHNDIGLVQIDGKIALKENVKKVKLLQAPVPAGTKCILTGWGYTDQYKETEPNDLQVLDYMIITIKECNEKLPSDYQRQLPLDEKLQVCVISDKEKGACYGDSGGPLVTTDEEPIQVGVVSWGVPCAWNFPDVFASVAGYKDWIAKNMK